MIDAAITEQVRALERLDLDGLRAEWSARYGQPPVLRSPDLLARLLAWRIQADAVGGLDVETKATLFRKSLPVAAPTLGPGMQLKRAWRGTTQTVDVVAGGFRWEGRTFSSLSQVALAITGVKWNGPRFFGLRQDAPW